MPREEKNPCVACAAHITTKMHSVQCDMCKNWQHRKCGTGIDHIQYRLMKAKKLNISWMCTSCKAQGTDDVDVEPMTRADEVPEEMEVETEDAEAVGDFSDVKGLHIADRPVTQVEQLEDHLPTVLPTEVEPVTYEVIAKGTRVGGRMLVSSDAYSYNVKRENKETGFIYWTCSMRTKTFRCPAWVKQYQDRFVESAIWHQHPADPTRKTKLKVLAKVKENASENLYRPVSNIVSSAIEDLANEHKYIAKPANLTRVANRRRQKMRIESQTIE